jgi:predicted peptidase
MVEAIKSAGGEKIRYTEFPGVWHDSWIPAYKTEGLVDWLFEQHK